VRCLVLPSHRGVTSLYPMAQDHKTMRQLPVGTGPPVEKREGSSCAKMHAATTKLVVTSWLLLSILVGWEISTPPVVAMGDELPWSLQTERTPDPHYWRRMGYAEMVPALRLPTTHDARDIIRVYLLVPPGQSISAPYLENEGRYTLLFPTGTRVDRVESLRYRNERGEFGETPMDVRGILIEAGVKPLAPLLGWPWSANDTAAREEATHRTICTSIRTGPLGRPSQPRSGNAAPAHPMSMRSRTAPQPGRTAPLAASPRTGKGTQPGNFSGRDGNGGFLHPECKQLVPLITDRMSAAMK
jgi:hypothetical protein